MKRLWQALIIAAMILSAGTCALAADWQWPSEMSIAGFNITGIKGSVRSDGSGSASGQLQIPGISGQRISLVRSSGGSITGESSISARAGGADIQGDFNLSSSGLKGRGTIRVSSSKPVTNATISISSGGQFSGNGRIDLRRASISVNFSISGSLDVNGATSVRDETDTPLATYKFDGRLKIDGRMEASASGSVQRTGKMANQVTNYPVSNASVNLNDGSCEVNVGGVSVTFHF